MENVMANKDGDWMVGGEGRVWVWKKDAWSKTGIVLSGKSPTFTVKEGWQEVRALKLSYSTYKPDAGLAPVPDEGEIGFGPYEGDR